MQEQSRKQVAISRRCFMFDGYQWTESSELMIGRAQFGMSLYGGEILRNSARIAREMFISQELSTHLAVQLASR